MGRTKIALCGHAVHFHFPCPSIQFTVIHTQAHFYTSPSDVLRVHNFIPNYHPPSLCQKNTHILIHAHHPIYSCDKLGLSPLFLYTSTLAPFFSQSHSYTSPSKIFSTDGEVVPSHALGKRSTVAHTHAHSQTAAGGHPQGAVLLAVP